MSEASKFVFARFLSSMAHLQGFIREKFLDSRRQKYQESILPSIFEESCAQNLKTSSFFWKRANCMPLN